MPIHLIEEEARQAALKDIVQEFDPASATTTYNDAHWALDYLEREGPELVWILDTHPPRTTTGDTARAGWPSYPSGYDLEPAPDQR